MRDVGRRALVVALVAGLAACNFAPRYQRPASPVAPAWPAAPATGAGTAATELGWRDVLGDPRLQALIALALENNRDLRIAALNVALTRAQYRIQRSELFPTVQASAGYTNSRIVGLEQEQFSLGVGLTSYELDLFGRVRNLKKQALEQYLATAEAHRASHLSLVAEVAIQYLTTRAIDEQLAVARRTLVAVDDSLAIARRTFEAGRTSEVDVTSAEAQVETARADIAGLRRQLAQAENALVLLIGQPLPADLPPPLALDAEQVVAELGAGLPSDLLQRRPDILAAEHQLIGANANIGVARAAFFPTISLTAFGGLVSPSLDGLFESGSRAWTFAPAVSVPLFTGGRNVAGLDAARVNEQIAVASYERAIQIAFREVADSLVARTLLDEQLAAQVKRSVAERRRYELAGLRYSKGIDSYLTVLTAQRDLYGAEQQVIQLRLAQLTNVVFLYKALGGGWNERSSTASPGGGKTRPGLR